MDPNTVIYLENGFELHPIWSDFNTEFRDVILHKFGNEVHTFFVFVFGIFVFCQCF